MCDLTVRQREVAQLVALDWSTKRIAKSLGVSPVTVKAHIAAAASRVPGEGRARHRLTVWFLDACHDDTAV